MSTDCVFCRIVERQVEASRVYEDDATLAFIDLRQPNPGHVLVVPKVHVPMLDQLPLDVAARLMQTVVLVTGAVRRGFAPDGINIWQSNGVAAGQEVFHVHMHVFPRRAGDDCLRIYPQAPPTPARAELDRLAARLRAALAE